MIRLIAAIDSQRGIATDTGIPWTLPGDSAYFRQKTSSGLIVMGRATYDEFAAPLHDRENFVFSTSTAPLRTGFSVVGSLDQLRAAHPGEDVWVIGGSAVYAETIGQADELLLTQVMGDFGCTKFFPPYQTAFALESTSEEHREGGIRYQFETWRRLDPESG
jgi:dihydrofolate reductase